MPDRRLILTGTAALGLTSALPLMVQSALAQTPERPNPMPDELRRAIERDPNAPVLGNPEGTITLTEFFDYNCPFCREMVGVMQELISTDPQLRVVYREWPVFGEGSEFAARASLASLRQGKYWPFHAALMGMKERAAEATVLRVARRIGLDMTRLRADMERPEVSDHISASFQLADHMGLRGVPTFISGDSASFGLMTLAEAQEQVADARKTLGIAS